MDKICCMCVVKAASNDNFSSNKKKEPQRTYDAISNLYVGLCYVSYTTMWNVVYLTDNETKFS